MLPALSLPQPDTNKPAVKAATQSTVENNLRLLFITSLSYLHTSIELKALY